MTDQKQTDNGHAGPLDGLDDNRPDRRVGAICLIYLMTLLAFFCWQLFDTWIGQHTLPRALGYRPERLDTPGFHLVAFAVIGGGLGGIVNGLRSALNYYNGFNRRYAWKYISLPWMGATLALFVYALLRSSIAVFGGNPTTDNVSTTQVLSNFAAGALAGYGSKDVFIWLDAYVHRLFQVEEKVPDVTGKTAEAAVSRIHSKHLELGEVSTVPQRDGTPAGTVIEQSPSPDAPTDRGAAVDIAVAAGNQAGR